MINLIRALLGKKTCAWCCRSDTWYDKLTEPIWNALPMWLAQWIIFRSPQIWKLGQKWHVRHHMGTSRAEQDHYLGICNPTTCPVPDEYHDDGSLCCKAH